MDPDMAIGVIVFSAVFGALVLCYLATKYLNY